MNIDANDVIVQMEQQLALLRKAVEKDEPFERREAAAVIESYCQLLKGKTGSCTAVQPPSAEQAASPGQPLQPPVAKPPYVKEGSEGEKRNLLDF
ncbi:DUF5327 family protein [Shouchella shacheensis]|uniref:DUF5327 family protein n=1 Tax=Shouchella shacheensis TaxID=1649580 RepID=UPI00073FAA56|nr:DUF5327 family protein [Shouchella shacheensis]